MAERSIPDQFFGDELEELENMKKDKTTKPCPECGYKIMLYTPWDSPQPAWENNKCKACGYDSSKQTIRGETDG